MFDSFAIGLAGLVCLLVLIAVRVPVGYTMIIVGIAGISLLNGPAIILNQLKDLAYAQFSNYDLSVLPMFILMGALASRCGLSSDLFRGANAWLGRFRGGVAMAAIAACGGFGAVSGSSTATASTMGQVALPELRRYKYSPALATGTIAAGGTLGILIPPSIPMIVYGFVTEQSVIALFLAGIGPGLLLVVVFIGFSMIYARWFGGYTPEPAATTRERIDSTVRALPSIALALIVIGVIYTGVATPTEAAAIGFAVALLITGLFLRTLTLKTLTEAALESMVTTVAILLIVAGAKVFGKAITLYRIPQDISVFIGQNIDTPLAFILVVSVVLLIMGLVFEALSMVLIMTPVLLPAAMTLGFDPIWFGVYMVVMVECALITPPVGLNLYVIQSVARARLSEVSRGVLPFLLLMLMTVAILYVWTDLALYIPFKF